MCIKDTGTQKQDTQNELAQVGEFESIIKYGAYRIFHPISSYVDNIIAHSFWLLVSQIFQWTLFWNVHNESLCHSSFRGVTPMEGYWKETIQNSAINSAHKLSHNIIIINFLGNFFWDRC